MKKILLVSRGVPSKRDPMWGNFELDQAKALHKLGHQVVCMSIDRRVRFYWRKIGVTCEEINGIRMYNYFFPLPYRILPRFIHNFFVNIFTKNLFKFIREREGEFDVLHGHYLPNIRIATKIKEVVHIPVVGTEHWSELKRKRMKQSVRIDAKETYPKVDCLISVSNPLTKIIKNEFRIDSVFVGCVIDDVFDYIPKHMDGIFRFIAVGSLFKIKGFDHAIRAFAKANFGKNIQFHIIGEGGERSHLKQLIDESNLQEQVFLQGRKTRKEIMEWMSKSSVYVLSSRSENFATACMEALTAGLPAIMTKCGGPEDFVDESNSVLVSVDQVEEMTEAMKYMMENIEEYDGKKISEHIKQKYSPRAIAEQLTNIYNNVTEK
jgi:glycosyltransferase involved in cell wall biosynthesis